MEILQYIAAFVNIAFGIWSLVQPEVVAKASSMNLLGARGRAEMQTAFGGYFIGMGVAIVLLNDPDASAAIGVAWLSAAAARLVSLVLNDRSDAGLLTPSFYVTWVVEIVIGAMLVAQVL